MDFDFTHMWMVCFREIMVHDLVMAFGSLRLGTYWHPHRRDFCLQVRFHSTPAMPYCSRRRSIRQADLRFSRSYSSPMATGLAPSFPAIQRVHIGIYRNSHKIG
jgi:hypothetical protein